MNMKTKPYLWLFEILGLEDLEIIMENQAYDMTDEELKLLREENRSALITIDDYINEAIKPKVIAMNEVETLFEARKIVLRNLDFLGE